GRAADVVRSTHSRPPRPGDPAGRQASDLCTPPPVGAECPIWTLPPLDVGDALAVQNEASLLSSGLTGSFQDLLDAGFVAAGAGSGLGVVGWWRVREWLVRRAGDRGASRPRWSQSRSPFALPGLFRLARWGVRGRG